MTLILEKPQSEQLDDLDLEFMSLLLTGTLTQVRYDEIISLVATRNVMPDSLLSMIMEGEPSWREKHIQRYRVVFSR
jgi:hypothetical protein